MKRFLAGRRADVRQGPLIIMFTAYRIKLEIWSHYISLDNPKLKTLDISEANNLTSPLTFAQGYENHDEIANEKYHYVSPSMKNDNLVEKKKVSQRSWYKWAFVFFGLSALLPNAAILTDMDYFIK